MSSQVRQQVTRMNVSTARVSARRFGLSPAELLAAALSLIFFLLALTYYFTSVKPAQERLSDLESQLETQRRTLVTEGSTDGSEGQTAQDIARDALNSLEAFKSDYLRPRTQGRIALLNDINALVKKNNVQLMSGIEMSLEKTAASDKQEKSSGRKKPSDALNVFPEAQVRFTVSGQYPNLRSLLSELERNKQFLVINSINLLSVEQREGGRRSRGAAGGLVLAVELSAYFQP